MLPSVKTTWSRFSPDQIWANISWTVRFATAGNLLNTKGVLDSNVDGFGACGSRYEGGIMIGSSDDGGEGEFNHVEDSEAVTPVARDTLDGAQMIFSYENDWGTSTLK